MKNLCHLTFFLNLKLLIKQLDIQISKIFVKLKQEILNFHLSLKIIKNYKFKNCHRYKKLRKNLLAIIFFEDVTESIAEEKPIIEIRKREPPKQWVENTPKFLEL